MSKKLFILAGVLILALALAGSSLASPPKAEKPAANTLAVCGCGKVFVPDEKTEYLMHEGMTYACCTQECHEYAVKNPAAMKKEFEKQMSAAK